MFSWRIRRFFNLFCIMSFQVQKPMLKYNNSVIKPVQLFNHADLVTIRSNAEAARNAYSSLSQASSSSSNISTPFRSSVKPPTPTGKSTAEHGAAAAMFNQPPVSAHKSPSKGHTNPYARPLSAKDIVNELQNQKARKTPTISPMVQTNSGTVDGNSGTPMFGFQMNAFMRPQSAIKKDHTASHSKATAKSTNKSGDTKDNKSSEGKSEQAKTVRRAVPPTRLERGEADLSETLGSTTNSSGSSVKRNQFGPSKRDSSAVTQSSTGSSSSSSVFPSKVTSSSQTEGQPVAKTVSVSRTAGSSTDTSTAQTTVYAKPVSSLPRPGSQAPGSKPSTPEPQSKVRNLNYTPTKPYSEVMDPSPVSSTTTTVTGKPPVSATTKTIQTTETSVTKHGVTYVAPSNIGKAYDKLNSNMSTRTTGASTVYYSKKSKGEVVLHEQRPPVVGAASQPGKGMEKNVSATTLGSDMEEEDEESENGTPSG